FCLFFFQAEDGIRDFHVTGVQTCALPICAVGKPNAHGSILENGLGYNGLEIYTKLLLRIEFLVLYGPSGNPPSERLRCWENAPRSEERRVGKERRSREAPDD